MKNATLKGALFGYSKISVCQYIATLHEEFNAKLMVETESFREENAKRQQKAEELEAELAVYKQNVSDVSTALMDARKYAEHLRQEAQEETEQLRREAQEEAAQLRQQAQEEAEQLRREAREEAAQLRREAQEETEQFLLEIRQKGLAQTEKIRAYTAAIEKLRQDMAMLASQTDEAMCAFAEQFSGLKENFEENA